MSDKQMRWQKQKLQARAGGPVVKCKMCKVVWLYGNRQLIGICSGCVKIALNRNNMQIMAKGCEGVVSAGWSINDWPGRLKVKFKVTEETYADRSISYEEAMAYKGDIAAWVNTMRKVVQDEHANKVD